MLSLLSHFLDWIVEKWIELSDNALTNAAADRSIDFIPIIIHVLLYSRNQVESFLSYNFVLIVG